MYYYVRYYDHLLIAPPQEEYSEMPMLTVDDYGKDRNSIIRVFKVENGKGYYKQFLDAHPDIWNITDSFSYRVIPGGKLTTITI